MNVPDLSVVIVSWNVCSHLERCLSALPAAITPRYTWEVIVVDNASTDDSLGMVHERFPQVKVIANPTNLLYTAAANQGLTAARGRYLMLLNPDAFLIPQ